MNRKLKLIFLIILILSANPVSADDNNCFVLDFIIDHNNKFDTYDGYAFFYRLNDTCTNKTVDSIYTTSGISTTLSGTLYGTVCTSDSCYLMTIRIDSDRIMTDTIFSWNHLESITPALYIVNILFSERDSIFVFQDQGEYQGDRNNGSFVTKITDKHKLDTLRFLPYTQGFSPASFVDDETQILFQKYSFDKKNGADVPVDIEVYDILLDTAYNITPDNSGFVYAYQRISRDSYIVYMKVDTLIQSNLYRIKENSEEEQLTFLSGKPGIENFMVTSDTSIIYNVLLIGDKLIFQEERNLIITPRDSM